MLVPPGRPRFSLWSSVPLSSLSGLSCSSPARVGSESCRGHYPVSMGRHQSCCISMNPSSSSSLIFQQCLFVPYSFLLLVGSCGNQQCFFVLYSVLLLVGSCGPQLCGEAVAESLRPAAQQEQQKLPPHEPPASRLLSLLQGPSVTRATHQPHTLPPTLILNQPHCPCRC